MARKDRLKKRLRKLLPVVTVTLTGLPFALWAPPAQAFFPPVFPGSPPVAVVPPTAPPPLVVVPPAPPVAPPPVIVPPVTPPPIVIPPVSPPPITTTPEPATLVTGLIGLAAALAARRLKRQKGE